MAFYTEAGIKAVLKDRGLRLTPQRERILRIFQTLPQGQHLNAEELHQLLRRQEELEGDPARRQIGLATVYRTVKLMALLGILRELELAEGHKHYELNQPSPQHHHHLVCVNCHKTIEFTNEVVLQICRKQAQSAQFDMLDCQMTIHAICPEAVAQGWPSVLPADWECPRSGWSQDSSEFS